MLYAYAIMLERCRWRVVYYCAMARDKKSAGDGLMRYIRYDDTCRVEEAQVTMLPAITRDACCRDEERALSRIWRVMLGGCAYALRR